MGYRARAVKLQIRNNQRPLDRPPLTWRDMPKPARHAVKHHEPSAKAFKTISISNDASRSVGKLMSLQAKHYHVQRAKKEAPTDGQPA